MEDSRLIEAAMTKWAGFIRVRFLPVASRAAVLTALIGPAQAQSLVEFLGSSRLTVKATAYGAQKEFDSQLVQMSPDARNENSLQVTGAERGACGVAGRAGQSIVDSSARLATNPVGFELELGTSLRVQGGTSAEGKELRVPLGPKVCIPGPSIETEASAEASSKAFVEIRFNQDTVPGSYWLDLTFASKNQGGQRDITLKGPDGQVITPVSNEPVLLRVSPNTSWFLEAVFSDRAHDIGKCCGKTQQGSLSVVAAIRPIGIVYEQQAPGSLPDRSGQFDAVGLLVSRSTKGEPIPVCTATVVGRRTLLTAAKCLLPFGINRPSAEQPLWFVRNANVQAGLRRGLVNVVEWSTKLSKVDVDAAVGAGGDSRSDDRTMRYSPEVTGMALVKVDADVDKPAPLHDGRVGLNALLSRTGSVGTLVSFGPSAETAYDNRSAVSWVRNSSMVSVIRDATPNELVVRAPSPGCGVNAGSPVFVDSAGSRVLVGIVEGGDVDCRSSFGSRVETQIDWLRLQISR